MSGRLARLVASLRRDEAALVTRPVNVRYLTGVALDPHERFYALWVQPEVHPVLFLPALDLERAGTPEVRLVPVADGEDPAEALRRLAPPTRLLVEYGHMTLSTLAVVRRAFGEVEVGPLDDRLERLRAIKDEEEARALEAAGRAADRLVQALLDRLRLGVSEADLAAEAERVARALGGCPFAPIVLFGERTALPHGEPSDRTLARGDAVLFDVGVSVGGYVGDITRTFVVAPVPEGFAAVYETVHAAAAAGRAAVRAGQAARTVDAAARGVIEAAGYGAFFTHRVGHGLGLETHEPPFLTSVNDAPLEPGMALTVEPGIYLPGRFGVRIEDDLLVEADGARVLTAFPRELQILTL
jgi:Xaa-Pro dipeptidase